VSIITGGLYFLKNKTGLHTTSFSTPVLARGSMATVSGAGCWTCFVAQTETQAAEPCNRLVTDEREHVSLAEQGNLI